MHGDFCTLQIHAALGHLHRRHLLGKIARLHGSQRFHVRVVGKLVLRVAADLPLRGHFLGGEAHAVGNTVTLHIVGVGKNGGRQAGRIAHHGYHAHALGARGDHYVGLAHTDAVRRHLYRTQARSAEAVDGDAAHGVGQPGQNGPDTRHIQALLRLGNSAAADHVFHRPGVQPRHLRHGRFERHSQQVIGPHVAEKSPVGTANRRARGCDDIGFLDLFHHQFLTGLPVFIMPMIRSCVFGCVSNEQKALRSSAIKYSSLTRVPASTSPPVTTSAISAAM